MSKPIRLYWAGGADNSINFGDTLSPLLVSRLTGREVVYASPETCDLAAIGSILDKTVKLQKFRKFRLRFDPIRIWGTGARGAEAVSKHAGLDVYAVRGPLTRNALGLDSDFPMGDPGLLVDRFQVKASKHYRWGIIPHFVDMQLDIVKEMHRMTTRSIVIDLKNPDILETMRQIQSCDFIISSSLHGLITADVFGVPNVWMSISKNVVAAHWKFNDYFTSVGRGMSEPTSVLLDLKELEDTAILSDRATIKQRQDELLDALSKMPFD